MTALIVAKRLRPSGRRAYVRFEFIDPQEVNDK
jgi:hypothetical protein